MSQFEHEHIYELIKRTQEGDASAKEALVVENLKLVYSVCARFYDKGVEREDLHQIGTIGLLLAAEKFDLSRGLKFSTYAVPLILGELKRYFRDTGPIKVSRDLKKTARQIASFSENFELVNGRPPGVLEIAENLHLTPEEIANAEEATSPIRSISAPTLSEGQTLEDTLPDECFEPLFLEKLDVWEAVKKLPKREREIVLLRYGKEKTQSEIARRLGLSQVQVSRLEKKILARLQESLKCEENCVKS